MQKIDIFLDCIMNTFSKMDENAHWPMRVDEIAPYYSYFEAKDIYRRLRQLEKDNVSLDIVSSFFVGPSLIRELLPELIVGLKVAGYKEKERVWAVNYLFKVLEYMQFEDPFCCNGQNQILNKDKVNEIITNTQWISIREQPHISTLIHKVSASALSLIWGLYFYPWANIGFEMHGPYNAERIGIPGSILLIRDFIDLKPLCLWPEMTDFDYCNVQLLVVYTDINMSFDMFNHLIHQGNLPNSSVFFSFIVDGHSIIEINKIEDLLRKITNQSIRQAKFVNNLPRKELINKFIEIRYYLYKKLKIYFGDDWHPPLEVTKRVNKYKQSSASPGNELTLEQLRKAFDPRDEFIPEG